MINRNESKIGLMGCLITVAIVALAAAYSAPFLFGNNPKSQAIQTTSNADYQAALLFTIDGMKVYRFLDNDHYIYFVDGRNSSTVWEEQHRSSKMSYSESRQVQTVKP